MFWRELRKANGPYGWDFLNFDTFDKTHKHDVKTALHKKFQSLLRYLTLVLALHNECTENQAQFLNKCFPFHFWSVMQLIVRSRHSDLTYLKKAASILYADWYEINPGTALWLDSLQLSIRSRWKGAHFLQSPFLLSANLKKQFYNHYDIIYGFP